MAKLQINLKYQKLDPMITFYWLGILKIGH